MKRELEVDKGVPLAPRGHWQVMALKMDVGDSVLLRGDSRNSAIAIYIAGKKMGRRFTMRETNLGFRVWRVS